MQSTILRNSIRAGRRQLRFNSTAANDFKAEYEAKRHHADETTELWRRVSYYICIPGIAVCTAYVYKLEQAHAAHEAHLAAENDGVLPQPPAYDYLNKRARPFPWGMNSLFFNPRVNKDMSDAE